MKRTISLMLIGSAAFTTASCGLAELNAVCVTGYTATVKPQQPGAATGSAEFRLTFTNPDQMNDAKGAININLAVEAKRLVLGSPASNVSSSTPGTGYELPATTVYPAGVKDGFTTDMIINAPHDNFVRYDIEAYTNIPGMEYDGSPCHTFKATDIKL